MSFAALLVALLLVATRGVAFAQEAGGGGGGLDLGGFLGDLGDAFGRALTGLRDSVGGGFDTLWAQLWYALGMLPRLLAMVPLLVVGLLARALIHTFDLGEVGLLLTQAPEGPLREGWVQTMVQDSKGIAFVLLPAALALRAFAWNVGLSREDAGELLRDAFVAAVLIATIDGWALLAIRVCNALAAGLSGGDLQLPGATDAAQMAQAASLPLAIAPLTGTDAAQAIQAFADQFAVWVESTAAQGLVALVWAVCALFGAGAAILRAVFIVVLFVLAPLAPVGLVIPWGSGFLRGWTAIFLGMVGVQLGVAVLLRVASAGLVSALLPSQAGTTSVWSVLTGVVSLLAAAFLLWKGALGGLRVGVTSLRQARSASVAASRVVVRATPVAARVGSAAALAARAAPVVGGAVRAVFPAARPGPPAPPSPPASASTAGPAMFTHAHVHGHLINRGEASWPATPAPAARPAAPAAKP